MSAEGVEGADSWEAACDEAFAGDWSDDDDAASVTFGEEA